MALCKVNLRLDLEPRWKKIFGEDPVPDCLLIQDTVLDRFIKCHVYATRDLTQIEKDNLQSVLEELYFNLLTESSCPGNISCEKDPSQWLGRYRLHDCPRQSIARQAQQNLHNLVKRFCNWFPEIDYVEEIGKLAKHFQEDYGKFGLDDTITPSDKDLPPGFDFMKEMIASQDPSEIDLAILSPVCRQNVNERNIPLPYTLTSTGVLLFGELIKAIIEPIFETFILMVLGLDCDDERKLSLIREHQYKRAFDFAKHLAVSIFKKFIV